MKLLLAASKIDFPRLLDVRTEVWRALGGGLTPGVELVSSDALPWQKVIESRGSWDAAYAWAAQNFDACVLVETDLGALGRGTYQIAQEFLRRNKRVVVLRDGKFATVQDVRLTGVDDWKRNYGAVVL